VGRAKARRGIVGRHAGAGADARKVIGNRVPTTEYQLSLPHRPGVRQGPTPTTARRHGSPSTQPYRRERPWCPPSRRVPHKWSGRRPVRYMGRVSGLSFSNAEDCLSSEGGRQGLPRETPKCRERRHSRAREPEGEPSARCKVQGATCKVRGARCEVRGARCKVRKNARSKAERADQVIHEEPKKTEARGPPLLRYPGRSPCPAIVLTC
jgi:hypothetical protein